MARRLDVQYVQFYTKGNAAYKVAPVAPLPTAKLPRVKKQKRIVLHIDPVAVAGIIMAAFMMVLMTVGVIQLHNARQNVVALENQVDALWQEHRQLNAAYEDGYDIADVEKTALALGMVPREEVTQIVMQVPDVPEEKEPGPWERIYTFLTGLFA